MSPEKPKSDPQAPGEEPKKPGMHPEFALRNAPEIPIGIDKEVIYRAFEAGVRQNVDPENPANWPVLKADKLEFLSKAYAALAADKLVPADTKITAINFDDESGMLSVLSKPEKQPIAPIPLLGELAKLRTLDGPSKEQTYENVRLAHGLAAHVLAELAEESADLSDEALSAVQSALQALRENTIHSPLSSGLSRHQTAGLLLAIEVTITSDPVKAVLWEDINQIQKALDRLSQN